MYDERRLASGSAFSPAARARRRRRRRRRRAGGHLVADVGGACVERERALDLALAVRVHRRERDGGVAEELLHVAQPAAAAAAHAEPAAAEPAAAAVRVLGGIRRRSRRAPAAASAAKSFVGGCSDARRHRPLRRAPLAHRRALARAWADLDEECRGAGRLWAARYVAIVVAEAPRAPPASAAHRPRSPRTGTLSARVTCTMSEHPRRARSGLRASGSSRARAAGSRPRGRG